MKYKKPEKREQLLAGIEFKKDGISINKAAKEAEIPYSTLRKKFIENSNDYQQPGIVPLFSQEEEEDFVKWIVQMEHWGCPRTKQDILNQANRSLEKFPKLSKNGGKVVTSVGRGWLDSFMKRHPELTLRKCELISEKGFQVKEATLKECHEYVRQKFEELNCTDILDGTNGFRMYTLDEISFCLYCKEKLVVGKKGKKHCKCRSNGEIKKNVTSTICCDADGNFLKPCIIYPFENQAPSKYVEASETCGFEFTCTKTGWQNHTSFMYFLEKVFLRHIEKVQKPVALFLDGHRSHLGLDVYKFCELNEIILVCFYPNSTHLLSPLDLRVFNHAQREFENAKKEHFVGGKDSISLENFPTILRIALDRSLLAKNAVDGFRSAGLKPYNFENIKLEEIWGRKKENSANLFVVSTTSRCTIFIKPTPSQSDTESASEGGESDEEEIDFLSTDQLKFNLVKKKLNLIKTDLARTTVELNKYEKSVEKAEDAGVGIESYLSAYEKLTKSHENLLNVVRENNPEQTQQNSDSKFNDCVNGFIRTVGLKAYNEMVNGTFEVLENEDILKLQLFRVFSDIDQQSLRDLFTLPVAVKETKKKTVFKPVLNSEELRHHILNEQRKLEEKEKKKLEIHEKAILRVKRNEEKRIEVEKKKEEKERLKMAKQKEKEDRDQKKMDDSNARESKKINERIENSARRRGRQRKIQNVQIDSNNNEFSDENVIPIQTGVTAQEKSQNDSMKRKRGRPKKNPTPLDKPHIISCIPFEGSIDELTVQESPDFYQRQQPSTSKQFVEQPSGNIESLKRKSSTENIDKAAKKSKVITEWELLNEKERLKNEKLKEVLNNSNLKTQQEIGQLKNQQNVIKNRPLMTCQHYTSDYIIQKMDEFIECYNIKQLTEDFWKTRVIPTLQYNPDDVNYSQIFTKQQDKEIVDRFRSQFFKLDTYCDSLDFLYEFLIPEFTLFVFSNEFCFLTKTDAIGEIKKQVETINLIQGDAEKSHEYQPVDYEELYSMF